MPTPVPPNLHVGTSSWSSPDWCGSFYPDSVDPGDMIRVYSEKLRTVEVDSTWYRTPSRKTVESWKAKTPAGFIFSAKVPRVISHDKYLEGCEAELNEFISVISGLGSRLGPMILQFPYVAKGKDPREYRTGEDFVRRLKRFLPLLPAGFQWGIEVRNPLWVQPPLLDLLRSRGISLVFIDYYTMDPLPVLAARDGVFTSSFVYVRFLGHRKEMDAAVKQAQAAGVRKRPFESILLDRTRQMRAWIPPLKAVLAKAFQVYVYFNNHYAGYAPGSVELFGRLFEEAAPGTDPAPPR